MIKVLQGMTEESVNFVETQNLFNVSMGKGLTGLNQYYEKAVKFQNELEEKLGVNIEESMNYQALFNSMSKSMGISAKYAYILSENFTKLGYDLSSLYNIDPENAMQKLRAGLAGQTKPLRDLGLDITQQSLQPIADELGIETSIKNMSQAEKMILRYIAVLKQAQIAQGDFANTMETPANQLRIFNAQITAFKRNMGNLWQGLLGGVLPYINGIMMVINELLKMVAKLFGFKVSDQTTNISASIGADDLADDLGTATGKAKELKNQLMGFDEINNISLPSSSGSGSSGASVGGIDQRLLDAMSEYDNLMDSVSGKATKIRDKIMEWLGFTKEINPLTGEISWELNEGLTNFEKILDVVKTIGVSIGTWKISEKITKFMENLGILNGKQSFNMALGLTLGITGIYLEYKGTQHLLNGDVDVFSIVETCLGVGAGTFGIANILKSIGLTGGKHSAFTMGNALKLSFGVMLGIQSFQVFSEGVDTDNIKMQIGGLLESAFGGYLIGSQIGGWKIGLTVALVFSVANVTTGILSEEFGKLKEIADSMWEEIDNILESNGTISEHIESLRTQKEEIQKNTDASLTQIGYAGTLVTELEALIDSSGRVYEGYESRVGFILNQLNEACGTEYSLVGNQITKNGELVKSYDDIKNSIYKIIEAKKSQILLEANEEAYALALKNRMELYKDVQQAETDLKNAIVEMYEQGIDPNSEMAQQAIKQLQDNLELAKQAYQDNTRDIIYYEDLQTAIIEGDTEKINNAISNMTSVYETEQGKVCASLSDRIKDAQMFAENTKVVFDELGKDIDEQTQARLDASVRTLADGLAEQTKTIELLTPDQIESWKLLAEGSYEIYEEELNKLDPEIRTELQNITGIIVEKTPEVERVTAELAEKMLDQLDNNSEMKKQAVENVKAYLQGLSDEDQREMLKQCGIDNVEEVMKGLKEGNLAEDVGVNIIKGLHTGLQNNYWQGRTLSTAFTFASNVLSKFKKTFGISSPSRKTKKFGIYLLEGLGLGVKKESRNVLNTVSDFSNQLLNEFDNPIKEFSDGIEVDTKEFAINASEYVDYGAISGNISTKINNNNLGEIIAGAIVNGMQKAEIQVDIKAETEEGVIVKKASKGFKEFVEQTGELPFPVPV